jgi:hypothetical protein
MSKKKWQKVFGNHPSLYFDAKEAIRYGFADELIDFAKKPTITLEDVTTEDEIILDLEFNTKPKGDKNEDNRH